MPPPSILCLDLDPFTAAPGEIHWGGSLHISCIDSLHTQISYHTSHWCQLLWSPRLWERQLQKKRSHTSEYLGLLPLPNPEFTGENYLQSGIPKFPISVFPPLQEGRIPDFCIYCSQRRRGIRNKELRGQMFELGVAETETDLDKELLSFRRQIITRLLKKFNSLLSRGMCWWSSQV